MTPDRIIITVDENPDIYTDVKILTQENHQLINNVMQAAIQAANLIKERDAEKAKKKTAEERQMQAIMLIFLESPTGITKGEMLAAGESENLISTIAKFRKYLSIKNQYVIKKRTAKKQSLYILDPVR